MKKLLLALFCLLTFPVAASHIVGGEFELIHLPTGTFSYRINLILYFDENNGSQDAKDQKIQASIYRKRDNAFMRVVDFSGFDSQPVAYTQPACSTGGIRTSKLTYTTTLTLPSTQYGDAEGYYIIWERCCRNYAITNIISQDPNAGGQGAGQTFYLEFPPVVKNGQPFINSSPRLFPPLNDYACPNKPYYVDFAGVDDDGDLLVYSLVTPLSTHSAEPLPASAPAPYPLVQWLSPFNSTNILNGIPDLKISADGFLTATPPQLGQGLYVFAVKCEEFRSGVKIGEVRRDFQLKVLDMCGAAEPPQILGRKLTDPSFTYDGTMSITFASGMNDADRCVQVEVSDPDALRAQDGMRESVTIKAIPIGFKKDISGILPAVTSTTLLNGSTEIFSICFDECPYVDGPFQIGIVAYDDACSQPLTDTLKVMVNIQRPSNQKPYFTTADVTDTFKEDEEKTWQVSGVDADGDGVLLIDNIITDGFDPAAFGIGFVLEKRTDKEYEAKVTWNTHCNGFDFADKTSFDMKVVIKDTDKCRLHKYDTMTFNLNVTRPGADPIIDSDLTPDPQERDLTITKKMFETLSFNVKGTQSENHFLVVGGDGQDFTFSKYDMTFPSIDGNGTVSSLFQWPINCDKVDLKTKDVFDLQFILVDDRSKCKIYKADTLDVHVTVLPTNNVKPRLTVSNADMKVPFIDNALSVEIGQQISLDLNGTDFNNPPAALVIDLVDASGNVAPEGYEFISAGGNGHAQAQFIWQPDCAIFKDGVYTNNYVFLFSVANQRCFDVKGDTSIVSISIHDIEREETDFIPPNFVSPNDDTKNEFFAMMMKKNEGDEDGELVSILPKDNCASRFVDISIYNRWGKEVFSSDNRDFKWFPKGEAAGVYFYYLHFSDKVYKGSVSVRY